MKTYRVQATTTPQTVRQLITNAGYPLPENIDLINAKTNIHSETTRWTFRGINDGLGIPVAAFQIYPFEDSRDLLSWSLSADATGFLYITIFS